MKSIKIEIYSRFTAYLAIAKDFITNNIFNYLYSLILLFYNYRFIISIIRIISILVYY